MKVGLTGRSWLQAVGADSVDGTRGLYFNRVSLALAAAVEAQGVVLSLEQLAMDDLSNGRLVVPFHHEVELSQAYYMISRQPPANTEHVVAFKRWLMEEAAMDARTKSSWRHGPDTSDTRESVN